MSETKPLSGKVAVVTGGGRGIGAAISERLAELGAAVAICGRSLETAQAMAARLSENGAKCRGFACDVSDWASVQNLARQVEREFGSVQILVNNAGIGGFATQLHSLPVEQWDAMLNTNLRGVFYCIKAFAPKMIEAKGGDIVNISSIASKNPLPQGAAYAASKWGLNGLSYSV